MAYDQTFVNNLWGQELGKTAGTRDDANLLRSQATGLMKQQGMGDDEINGMMNTAETNYFNSKSQYNPYVTGSAATDPTAKTDGMQYGGGAQIDTTKSGQWNGGAGPLASEIANARAWSTGKTSQEIAAKAKELGVTPDQFGTVFGYSGADVAHTGYGSDTGLLAQYQNHTWDGSKWVAPGGGKTITTGGGGTLTNVGGSNGSGTNVDSTGTPTLGFNLSNIQNAEQWTVDPKTQTVAGQLEGLLASDNPLMIQARTRALQQQNASGRLNSTMAQSAGDSAMYDAALQIATPDAAMYADNAKYNTSESNTFARDANGFLRDGVMADFNVRANDWAADKTQNRTLARDAVLNGYTTERDATLNGYTTDAAKTAADVQAQRDAVLNGYTVGATATAAEVQAARDAQLAGYTTARDAQGHQYNLAEIAATPRAATPIDHTADQRAWQLDDRAYEAATAAERREYDANLTAERTATSTLTNLRADFNTSITNLITKELDPKAKDDATESLVGNYNKTVGAIASGRGWDSTKTNAWIVKVEDTSTIPAKTDPEPQTKTSGNTGSSTTQVMDGL